jgi:vesicle-fusing ATPase
MSDFFDAEIFTPTINSISAVEAVLKEVKVFTDDELVQVVQQLRAANLEGKLNIGVKKLLMVAEMAKQDDVGTIDKFLTELVKEGVNS